MVGNKELGLGSQAHGGGDQADVHASSGNGGRRSTKGGGFEGIEGKETQGSTAAAATAETAAQEDLVLPVVPVENVAFFAQKFKSTKSSGRGFSKEKTTKCK